MKNANRLGSTLGLTFAALYVLCSLFFVGWPQGYVSLTAALFHGFSLSPTPGMSFGGFIVGLVSIAIVGYVAGALYSIILDAMSGTTKVS